MLRPRLVVLSLSTLLLDGAFSSIAHADGDSIGVSGSASATTPAPSGAAAATAPKPAEGPRRDPRGVKGISPFWEALKKGDDAAAAHDLDGAKAAYDDAIKADPHNGMGQYRIGELELARGHLKEAVAAWQEALRFSGENASLKAKVLFVLADVEERQRAFEEETNGWNAYEAHVKAAPAAKAFPESAADRKRRIQEWKQLEIDYGAVKERIKQRLAEADKKAAESAQSPRNR